MSDQSSEQPTSGADRSARRPFNPDGGEDESGAPDGAADDHLHEDQKPLARHGVQPADQVDEDDPQKVEKLTRAGRDIEPDEGSD